MGRKFSSRATGGQRADNDKTADKYTFFDAVLGKTNDQSKEETNANTAPPRPASQSFVSSAAKLFLDLPPTEADTEALSKLLARQRGEKLPFSRITAQAGDPGKEPNTSLSQIVMGFELGSENLTGVENALTQFPAVGALLTAYMKEYQRIKDDKKHGSTLQHTIKLTAIQGAMRNTLDNIRAHYPNHLTHIQNPQAVLCNVITSNFSNAIRTKRRLGFWSLFDWRRSASVGNIEAAAKQIQKQHQIKLTI